jgi:hypothetical protein
MNLIFKLAFVLCPLCCFSRDEADSSIASLPKSLEIHIQFDQARPEDTLHLYLFSRFFPALEETPSLKLDAIRSPDGRFSFKIPVSGQYGYFSIVRKLPPGHGSYSTFPDSFIINL